MTAATIAVYGATGHTGRLVAAELAARDNDIVLAGRDAGALHALADELGTSARVRVAALDDPAALRTVTEDVGHRHDPPSHQESPAKQEERHDDQGHGRPHRKSDRLHHDVRDPRRFPARPRAVSRRRQLRVRLPPLGSARAGRTSRPSSCCTTAWKTPTCGPGFAAPVAGLPAGLALLDEMEAEHAQIDPLLAAVDDALVGSASNLAAHAAGLASALEWHLKHEEDAALPLIQSVCTPGDWRAFARARCAAARASRARPATSRGSSTALHPTSSGGSWPRCPPRSG